MTQKIIESLNFKFQELEEELRLLADQYSAENDARLKAEAFIANVQGIVTRAEERFQAHAEDSGPIAMDALDSLKKLLEERPPIDPDVEAGLQLLEVCEDFMEELCITCPETIHQTDRVIENASEFIEELCNIVGYPEEDADQIGDEETTEEDQPAQ